MLNIWVATPTCTQHSAWNRAHHRGRSGPALRRAPGSAPAFDGPAGQSMLPFSKFADVRPKHCILAGASGTHSVCVCTIHQKVKLMMVGGKIAILTANDSIPLTTYNHCLAQIICNPPQPNTCTSCPGISQLNEHLREVMDDNLVDNVVYNQ